jgi:hypothetical protein
MIGRGTLEASGNFGPASGDGGAFNIFGLQNSYVVLVITLLILVIGNAVSKNAEPGYFKVSAEDRKALEGRA